MAYEALAQTLGIGTLPDSPLSVVDLIRKGLPGRTLNTVARTLRVSVADMGDILPVSTRTVQRYAKEKAGDPMSREVSDHLVQMAKVFVRSVEVLGDEERALQWLHEPCAALGREIPIRLLDTSAGIEMVEDVLGRLEYGVFS